MTHKYNAREKKARRIAKIQRKKEKVQQNIAAAAAKKS